MRQESPPVDMGAVDISGFHPPWHSLPDFQLREDMHHFVPPPPPQVEFFSNGRISENILYGVPLFGEKIRSIPSVGVHQWLISKVCEIQIWAK